MKELVVLGFASRELAEEARSRGAELDREGVLQLDGAALAYRRDDGRVELVQPMRLAPVGAASGAPAQPVVPAPARCDPRARPCGIVRRRQRRRSRAGDPGAAPARPPGAAY